MSLLPAAMQIKDDMPMTLGQAVKRALDPSTPVDRITTFNIGDHQLDGTIRTISKREPTFAEMPEALRHECETCCGTGRTMSMVCYGGPPIEREDDCPDCDGNGVLPSPKQESKQ